MQQTGCETSEPSMGRPLKDFFLERPQTAERIHLGQRLMPSELPRLYTGKPRVGLVITTYGAAPYVELGLAARQRLYPTLPVLVHDDASPDRDALLQLCNRYGAAFESNSSSLGHEMGDLSGIIGGLHWARSAQLDLLVKMSRRFVPLSDWVEPLLGLAEMTQFGTFGRRCVDFNLAMRTECFVMAVQPWTQPDILDEMTAFMLRNRISLLVEHYLLQFAQRVYERNSIAAQQWERTALRPTPRLPFAEWGFLSEGRRHHSPNYLWHETAPAEAYMQMAAALGLSFAPDAFSGILSQAQR